MGNVAVAFEILEDGKEIPDGWSKSSGHLVNVGKVALIRRALCGGKSAGSDFLKHLRTCMEFLNFESCMADSEVWRRRRSRTDGTEHWEYVLLYVDDVLCIADDPKSILRGEIGKYFVLKPKSIGPPKIYLGNKLSTVTLENGTEAWVLSSSQYTQAAVKNVIEKLKREDKINDCQKRPHHPRLQIQDQSLIRLRYLHQWRHHITNLQLACFGGLLN